MFVGAVTVTVMARIVIVTDAEAAGSSAALAVNVTGMSAGAFGGALYII